MFVINIENHLEAIQAKNVGQTNSSQQRTFKIYQQKYKPNIKR